MTDATYMVSWAGKFLTNGASSSTFHPCESETRHFWGIFSETVFAKALWSGNCKVTQFQWQESWIIAKITIKRKRSHQLEYSITRAHFSSLSTKKLCQKSPCAIFQNSRNYSIKIKNDLKIRPKFLDCFVLGSPMKRDLVSTKGKEMFFRSKSPVLLSFYVLSIYQTPQLGVDLTCLFFCQ